jgi:hypothetical protein
MRPTIMLRACAGLLILAYGAPIAAQHWPVADPYKQHPEDRNKLVRLAGIEVKGTRLPTESILRLAQLKIGQMVNYDILAAVCDRITHTGLISTVDYAYKVQPGQAGVVVSFLFFDELPLLPVSISPAEDSGHLWSCLEAADPIFTRSMPNTKAAINFYTANIDRCLANAGASDTHAVSSVLCGPDKKPVQIVFSVREKSPATTSQ